MTPSAAILALLLGTRPPLALTLAAERIQLPPLSGAVRLEPRPLVKSVLVHVGPEAAAAVAKKLSGASRLCPEARAVGDAVQLSCRTARLRASLVATPAGLAVDLHVLAVPPWRPDEEGPPLVPFDLAALRLGPCPGATPDVRGECAVAEGRLDEARERFEEAAHTGIVPLAELRLGDLALRADEPEEAVTHWRRAREVAPWGRLAAARLCELDPKCLASDQAAAVFDADAVERPLRADIVLRRARLTAFDGEIVGAARALVDANRPGGACAAALPWCRHVLLVALGLPAADGGEALAVYLDTPNHGDGPLAIELVRAAALQAERAGAPGFAASLLATATGRVPDAELGAHLRRVAELYLAGGDRARAEEITRFARTRLPAAELVAPAWAGIRKNLRPERGAAAAPTPASSDDPDIRAAQAALEASRLVAAPTGAHR